MGDFHHFDGFLWEILRKSKNSLFIFVGHHIGGQ